MLLIICNKIWQTGEWPTPWTQSLIITLLKKGSLQLCQNYHTISLISHPNKVMLRILLNILLKSQLRRSSKKNRQVSEQGGAQQSKCSILEYPVRNNLQHQQNLYHVFVDFKKAFDRVWHAALWATMGLHNINVN